MATGRARFVYCLRCQKKLLVEEVKDTFENTNFKVRGHGQTHWCKFWAEHYKPRANELYKETPISIFSRYEVALSKKELILIKLGESNG